MQNANDRARVSVWIALMSTACLLLVPAMTVLASPDSRQAHVSSPDSVWRRGIDLAKEGEFDQAFKQLDKLPHRGRVSGKLVGWLKEYREKQEARKLADRADFEKYVGYAKARIERKEFDLAMDWVLYARDCTEDRDQLLQSGWVQELVNHVLEDAENLRREQNWKDAWLRYSRLGELFEREPRYEKLERDVLTHWRLDTMFGEDTKWEEYVENVRWDDAEKALELIEYHYVEPPDFKKIAEAGLEHMLLLADSKSAQEAFDGLKNKDDRGDFVARVQTRLDRVRRAATVTRRETVGHFRRVIRDINRSSIHLPEELLVAEIMRGALEPLDDFTTIIWPTSSDEFDKHTRGNFIGVGISIVRNRVTDETEVVTPLEDAPAYRAGIQAGDIITHVDGKAIKGLSTNKVVDVITGPRNTEVTLTIRRGADDLEFQLRRELVKIQSVKGLKRDREHDGRWQHWLDEESGIAYVRVTGFQRNTVEDVANVLSELEAGNMRGLVFDLRGNPGGLLDSAFHMSELFLGRSEAVVSTRGRDRSENQRFETSGKGPWSDLPLIVLTDDSSASASEIVAGAIQDNKHGVVVGTRTFGKFSVQNLMPLGRSRAKLKLTTARYYLPSGRSLHREITSETWGVEPDVPSRLVLKERRNIWKMRREADRLGPPKPKVVKKDDDATSEDSDDEKSADKVGDDEKDKKGGADETAVADGKKDDEKEKLPLLEQPDENERPKNDPQLDTALLLMRFQLAGELYPTVAAADAEPEDEASNQ